MLKCCCGWLGVNLIPNEEDDTARCPECSIPFEGITADEAIVISPEEETQIKQEARLVDKSCKAIKTEAEVNKQKRRVL